ncbi:polyhydroxyalkanoic acid system family protein [Pendulispora brunnea]|uniref:Polyhydroxyalkanoic acid system family protein n=1 Tax=Pendulispora brunnea TaxID=2905690 RepID=A0ABZ2KJG5_9BACT
MATIDIARPHALTKEEAKKRAEELAKGMQEKLGIVWNWVGDAIEFNVPGGAAKGAKGKVGVSDREVRVEVDLPFMLKMMKGTIEEKIQEKLKALL